MPIAIAQITLHRSSVAELASGAYRICILQVSAAAAAANHIAAPLDLVFPQRRDFFGQKISTDMNNHDTKPLVINSHP